MWLAHALTLVRLPLVAVLWLGQTWQVVAAIAAAALSDLLDGPVARRARRTTPPPHPAWWDIGGWLDPLVDKIFVAGALGALWWRAGVPAWELGLVATREVLLVPLLVIYVRRPHAPLAADFIGKVTTAVQLITLGLLAAEPSAWPAAALCAGLGAATVVHYVRVRRPAT